MGTVVQYLSVQGMCTFGLHPTYGCSLMSGDLKISVSQQKDCCCLVAVAYDSFATLCTVAHQAPLSLGFSRQEYWSGLPFPPPGHLPNLVTPPASPALAAGSLYC